MFVRVDQRRKPHLPWATIAIIGGCVLISLWLAGLPADEHLQWLRHWGTVPAKLLDPQAPTLRQLFELRGCAWSRRCSSTPTGCIWPAICCS